ncbi:MAG: L,D-transpeptidase family protein [Alphaproteobacteria bacterium]
MDLIVNPESGHRGTLSFGDARFACALGRAGVVADKREGDGGTPAGRFPLRALRYRVDRLSTAETGLPAAPIAESDGWCDDPADPARYNRPVTLPYAGSAEKMWRDDALYDLVVILGHNDDPPVPGAGSAIFLHCASPDLGPTEGCVALPRATLLKLLPRLTPETMIEIRRA